MTKKEYVINGEVFHGCAELEKQFGVNRFTIQTRINRGWTIKEAVGLKSHINKSKTEFIIRGETFYGYDELESRFNIPVRVIKGRLLDYKWTLEEAVGLVPHVYGGYNEYIINGEVFHGHDELSSRFNVPLSTINTRIRRNWTIEEVCELIPPFTSFKQSNKNNYFKFDNICNIRFAYDTDNDSYYECKDNEISKIYSKTYLIQRWKEWKGIE